MATFEHKIGAISTNSVLKSAKGGKEMKYLDYSSVSGSIGNSPSNWSNWYIPRITRGVESYSRIGNQITIKAVELRLLLNRNSAGATVQRMHVLVLRTKEPYGVAAIAADLYSAPSTFSSPRSPEYANDFIALWETTVVLDSSGPNSVQIEKMLPCGFQTKYASNGGTVADCVANNVELLIWSDQSTNQPTVSTGSFRVWWTDD